MGSTSNWRRTLGNVRSFASNSMGGLRGGSNLASWVVAGTLAYFLWIKPSQDLKREQQVPNSLCFPYSNSLLQSLIWFHSLNSCESQAKAALAASTPDPYRYVETRKPIPDPQVRLHSYTIFWFIISHINLHSTLNCAVSLIVSFSIWILGHWFEIWKEEQGQIKWTRGLACKFYLTYFWSRYSYISLQRLDEWILCLIKDWGKFCYFFVLYANNILWIWCIDMIQLYIFVTYIDICMEIFIRHNRGIWLRFHTFMLRT